MTRPLVFILAYLTIGIIFGQQLYEYKFVALFVASMILSSVFISIILHNKYALLLSVISLMGFVMGFHSTQPNNIDVYNYALSQNELDIVAEVQDINKKYDNAYQYTINIENINNEKYSDSKAICYTTYDLKSGDVIFFKSAIDIIPQKSNITDFDQYSYYKSYDIEYRTYIDDVKIIEHRTSINSVLKHIRDKFANIYDDNLPSKEASFVKAIVLGDKTDLDEELYDKMRSSGIAHIVAISGLHISILVGIIAFFINRLSKKSSYFVLWIFLILYCIFTGLSPSVVRAALMCSILLFGHFIGRNYDVFSSAALTCIILLIVNPFYIYNIGFCYSFICVFAIAMMSNIIKKYNIKNKRFGKLISVFLISLVASIASKPFTIYTFYNVNTYDVITNLLVLPTVSILLFLSILSGVLSIFSVWVGRFLIGLPYVIIHYYTYVCDTMLDLPYFRISTGGMNIYTLIGIYILIIVLYNCIMKLRNVIYAFIPIIIICLSLNTETKPINLIDTNKVQTIIITQNDKCILVNCSSQPSSNYGKTRILNYLNYRNIKHIDSLYITKTDYYHSGGLIEIFDDVTIDTIYVLNTCKHNNIYNNILAIADNKNIELQRVTKSHIIYDNISVENAISLADNIITW